MRGRRSCVTTTVISGCTVLPFSERPTLVLSTMNSSCVDKFVSLLRSSESDSFSVQSRARLLAAPRKRHELLGHKLTSSLSQTSLTRRRSNTSLKQSSASLTPSTTSVDPFFFKPRLDARNDSSVGVPQHGGSHTAVRAGRKIVQQQSPHGSLELG